MGHSFTLKYANPIQSIMRAGDLDIGCETLSGTFTSYDWFNEEEYTEKLKKKIEEKWYEFISMEFNNK